MPIDNHARDLALGMAAALDAGEDVTNAKLEIVRYLMESSDAQVRTEHLLAFVNANAVMIALLMDVAPKWYQVGYLHGSLSTHGVDEGKVYEAPDSNLLFKQLAEAWPSDESPEGTA
ncbi:hypothetical protein [Cryobacterium sp. Y50]|uniref:hypothetical protein n=1 Tax=Cryobacterium sp. Y50 TaxID=2048286 RepID=UPI000CE3F8C4|nr:hypothetical protein [Cryobacterium sp. Y50]